MKKYFRGKLKDVADWFNSEYTKIGKNETITVIVGDPPKKKKPEPKSLSKKDTFEKLLKESDKKGGGKESGVEPGAGSEEGDFSEIELPNEEIPEVLEERINPPKWFLQKLKSILKDNTTNRSAGNKLYGDLDFKHLYKISTTNKVFSRREIISKKVYNIALIVDCSGSMCGNKEQIASKSASLLVRDFQKISNLMVLGFNRRQTIYKHFNSYIKETELFEVIQKPIISNTHSGPAGGNHDHMALRVAHKEIIKQKGQKIIVILSDGEPACGGCVHAGCNSGEGLRKDLENEITKIEQQNIPILSVGILTASTERFYKNNKNINDTNQIYEAIIELLDKTVRRLPVNC